MTRVTPYMDHELLTLLYHPFVSRYSIHINGEYLTQDIPTRLKLMNTPYMITVHGLKKIKDALVLYLAICLLFCLRSAAGKYVQYEFKTVSRTNMLHIS